MKTLPLSLSHNVASWALPSLTISFKFIPNFYNIQAEKKHFGGFYFCFVWMPIGSITLNESNTNKSFIIFNSYLLLHCLMYLNLYNDPHSWVFVLFLAVYYFNIVINILQGCFLYWWVYICGRKITKLGQQVV